MPREGYMWAWLSENGIAVAAFFSAVATAFAAFATYRAPLLAAAVSDRLR